METHPGPGQYLTFRLGRQYFAIDAACVRGVLPLDALRKFHQSVEFVCGTAMMRGRDFPVIDLKSKLDLPYSPSGKAPCIVAVEVGDEETPRIAGFIADRVTEVAYYRKRDLRRGALRGTGRPRWVLNPDQIWSENQAARERPSEVCVSS